MDPLQVAIALCRVAEVAGILMFITGVGALLSGRLR